jgi:hypothetical protein
MKKPQHRVHGRIVDGILHKDGNKVVKFWKHNGYGIDVRDLHNILGVVLDTQYDGKLYASLSTIEANGIDNMFGEEKQLILPVEHWRKVK